MNSQFRNLPSVDQVLSLDAIRRLAEDHPHDLLVGLVRESLDDARASIAGGKVCPATDDIAAAVANALRRIEEPSLRPVINATGVLLHTNLGRAPLSREAIAAIGLASAGYANLEFDLTTGRRGSRHVHLEDLLCRLSGASAAMVVNNNAAAVLLGLSALARRKEIVVSRGQAVEIGGSFRIPDVMRQSGAKLVEVGTTNRTYLADYEGAVTERTAALMRVHSSNFRLIGFVHEATLEELVDVGRRHDIPVLDDLGSGCLLDTTAFGLDPEPTVQQSVAAGAGLVFFSGDKLIGGPQAGIIVGDKHLVDRLKKHPLARALRIDKTCLIALSVTLIHYLRGEATEKIPVWRMIAAPLVDIDRRAAEWTAASESASVIDGESMVGGGSLPGGTLPTRLVSLVPSKRKRGGVQALAAALRQQSPPIIGRIDDDAVLLDPRSVLPEEDPVVIRALRNLAV